jgi:hypothetical protein
MCRAVGKRHIHDGPVVAEVAFVCNVLAGDSRSGIRIEPAESNNVCRVN